MAILWALSMLVNSFMSMSLIHALILQKESQKADEYIRMVKDQLEVAVSQCIQAAGHEIEPSKQRALLKVQLCYI